MGRLVRHIDLIPQVTHLKLILGLVPSFSSDNVTSFIIWMFSWRMFLCHGLNIS